MEKLTPVEKFALDTDLKNRSLSCVLWRPFIMFERKATEEDIKKFEQLFGAPLPEDYKQTLLEHGGHIPLLNDFAAQLDDQEEGEWREETMGPLYHCVFDCDPNYTDYHIWDPQLTKKNKRKLIMLGETSSGYPIVMSFPNHHILVLYPEGTALAGDDWTDFMWRMRLENKQRIQKKLQGPPTICCDSCGDVVTELQHFKCTVCTDFDLCVRCKETGFVTDDHKSDHALESVDPTQQGATFLLAQMTPYRFDPTPSEAEKTQRAHINGVRKTLQSSNLLYFKWDDAKFAEFEHLLSFDRRLNLAVRMEYYTLKKLLNNHHHFIDVPLRQERHAVWLPHPEEPGNYFAYSVGAYYLFNDPEILIIHKENLLSQRQTAITVNYVRTASLFDHKVVAGTTIDEIIHSFPAQERNNYEIFRHCSFAPATPEQRKQYLGFCNWFHCNFMDTLDFPVLVCILDSKVDAETFGRPSFAL